MPPKSSGVVVSHPVPETLANGRFAVRHVLGEYNHGNTYLCHDQHSGDIVAVKRMRDESPEVLGQFMRELSFLTHVKHRNLVQLRELLRVKEGWFLVMDWVDGQDFLSYVRPKGKLNEERLRGCLGQLIEGLRVLHAVGTLHRNIKPGNVLVTRTGRTVVLDFDLATRAPESMAYKMVGTAAYMSPEQAAGEELQPASDLYAVGVMVYQALTGKLPVEGSDLRVILDKQKDRTLSPILEDPAVPTDLDILCTAMLRRDPGARPKAEVVLQMLGIETHSL